jgi:hypothetical protein
MRYENTRWVRSSGRRRNGRNGRNGRNENGAALIEAAIVLPLLLILVFGALEFSMAFNQSGTLAAAARAGARTASTLAKDPAYAVKAANAVAAALQTTGPTQVDEVWIYKVAPGSGSGPVGGSFPGCSDCVGYRWVPATRSFDTSNPMGSMWPANAQNACPDISNDTPDRIGVYVRGHHDFVVKIFGATRTLTAKTVMRLEPYVGTGVCEPT